MITREEILRFDPCLGAIRLMDEKYPNVKQMTVEKLLEEVKSSSGNLSWLCQHFPELASAHFQVVLKRTETLLKKHKEETNGFRIGKPEEFTKGKKVMIAPWSEYIGQFEGIGVIQKSYNSSLSIEWVRVEKGDYSNSYHVNPMDSDYPDLLIQIKQ